MMAGPGDGEAPAEGGGLVATAGGEEGGGSDGGGNAAAAESTSGVVGSANNNAGEEVHPERPVGAGDVKSDTPSPSLPARPPSSSSAHVDEGRIDKAVTFLRNSEIHDVSTSDKRKYLETKAGLTPEAIDLSLERAARRGGMLGPEDGVRDDRGGLDRDYPSRGGDRHPSGPQHRDDDRYYDGRSRYRRDMNQDYDPIGDPRRRRPLYPSNNYPPQDGMNNVPPYNSNNMQYGSYPQGEDMPPPSAPSILPAWAGGFSLGVFCLAALRWLNGGDFVLFPPPTAASSESRVTESARGMAHGTKSEEEPLMGAGDDDTDQSDSQQEDDEVAEEDEEGEYEEDDEFEMDEADEDLNAILNGTAAADAFHHPDNLQSQHQPSYDELVLEIRALTSAIHSYKDVQEKANRAVHAQVGKVATDDAMGFLRKKKSEDVDRAKVLDGDAMRSLLEEVSGDLLKLKESISQVGEGTAEQAADSDSVNETDKDGEVNAKLTGDSESIKESDTDIKHHTEPTKQIDGVMDKVQKLLSILDDKVQTNEKKSVDSIDEDNGCTAIDNESKSMPAGEQPADSSPESAPSPSDETAAAKTQGDESQQQQPSPDTSETNQQQLEEALRTLSNDNDASDLKVGAQMLYLYCLNISKHPTVPRYRKIYTNNNTFRNKVGNLNGAKEFLSAVGFVERTNFFEWDQEDDAEGTTKGRLDFALVALELLKNGSRPKGKEEDGAASPLTAEGGEGAASPSTAESNELVSEAMELPVSVGLSVPGSMDKGMELN